MKAYNWTNPKLAKVDPGADMYREPNLAHRKTFKPRGVNINRFGTFEEKCAWMKAKQAGLIGPGRKKKR